MKEDNNKTHIFWTGGWDSTFRLIQLLATKTCKVQPHYIIRHEDSTGIEIYVMTKLRRAIISELPAVRSRFLSTIYINEDFITHYEDIDKEIDNLRKTYKINEQYSLMSNYCRQFNITQIEVALDRSPDQTPQEWLDTHFKDASAFKCFIYPVFELTKADMHQIAKENKWEKILYLTSFCRRPKIDITPCGQCGSCIDTVTSGLAFRFNFFAQTKAKIQIPFRKYWRRNYRKQIDNRFFKLIKKQLQNKI